MSNISGNPDGAPAEMGTPGAQPPSEKSELKLDTRLADDVVEVLAADKLVEHSRRPDAVAEIIRDRTRDLYSKVLFSISGIRINEADARTKWEHILRHKYFMSQKLGYNVGIRVAALDYLQNTTHELEKARLVDIYQYEQTASDALFDGLTGLMKKEPFWARLTEALKPSREHPDPSGGLLILDLDHFKDYNDQNGHLAGDMLLREVGLLLQDVLPKNAIGARYGGEEFVILYPDMRPGKCMDMAEKIRHLFEEYVFPFEENQADGITVSIGVSFYPDDANMPEALLAAADRRLYEAKTLRNRVCSRDGSLHPAVAKDAGKGVVS